jgi:hypothetical protein
MLPFGVTIPVTVPQRAEIPEGLTNNPVYHIIKHISFNSAKNTVTSMFVNLDAKDFDLP